MLNIIKARQIYIITINYGMYNSITSQNRGKYGRKSITGISHNYY